MRGSAASQGKQIDGVEGLFKLKGMGVDARFRGFLLGLAYGGGGNAYRHGSAEEGWPLRALCLLISLAGWLELNGMMDARREIREAFIRASKRRDAIRQEERTEA